MKKLLLLFSFTLGMGFVSLAQEVCNNGIDDDGDGFIDCYDSDCSQNSACSGFFIRDVECTAKPTDFPKFSMTLDFSSPNETTNHIGRMSIGDVDQDGIPEIVTMNRYTKKLFILNGNTGTVKVETTVAFEPLWEIAMADIDNDNCADLFFQGLEGSDLYLYSYDCSLNQKWRKRIYTYGGTGDANDAIEYGLADFDGDQKVELYVKDMILDAHTGTIIINTAATDANSWRKINGGPIAVDVVDDGNPNAPKIANDNLELVSGGIVYSINLGSRAANAGTRTSVRTLPGFNNKHAFSSTSTADYNLDGYLDILTTGGEVVAGRNITTVFFWDLANNAVAKYADPIPGNFPEGGCGNGNSNYYEYGWKNGTGRLNVADLDGDGKMNISFVSGKYLYALKEDMTLFWRVTINEETSGFTGCTLFDFNGDGSSEIVYRDERFLYIINGNDGSIYSQQGCISRTQREYPIVADVDADGSTELCVTCGFSDANAAANFCNLDYSRYSHVRVFKSAAEPWVPARRLWNQHGYFNVNVNDDLTIPRRQQKHHLVWSTNSDCSPGKPNRPLNNFLNQSPFLDSKGCPIYVAPDIKFVDDLLTVVAPTCPENGFTVSFGITNVGQASISGDIPITFYAGDPMLPGAIKLATLKATVNNFDSAAVYTVTDAPINGPGSAFILYVVLNDPGTFAPPIDPKNFSITECDKTNNIVAIPVNPGPVAITALKVNDNVHCTNPTYTPPDNGAVRAFIPGVGGLENTSDYLFYWSNGDIAKPIASADHVGATYTGLADGNYTVYAIHKTANCNSDAATVTVGLSVTTITVDVAIDQTYNNCATPNGVLRAIVNGGTSPESNYTFEWFAGNTPYTSPVLGIAPTLSGMTAGTYVVSVTEKLSGCQQPISKSIVDDTMKPVVDAVATDVVCATGNGGLSASVGTATSGFTFKWYKGTAVKPSPDFTGASANKPAGKYTVVAVNTTSLCTSDPVTVQLKTSPPIVVTATTSAEQTSCDAGLPNGAVSASVGGAAGYTFEWFKGQNTLPANFIKLGSALSGLDAGVYTVKATNDVTGCVATAEATVKFNVMTPKLAVVGTPTPNTNCTTPNGSVTVSVSFDTPSDYTFFWYDGPDVKAAPDHADTDNVLDNLAPGIYTVRAIHKTKNCEADPVTAEVLDATPLIAIDVRVAETVPPSDCNGNTGSLTVDIAAAGNTNGFDVQWYVGRAPFGAPAFFSQTGVVVSKATNLKANAYTVVVTNLDNGCMEEKEIDLPFFPVQTLELVATTDIATCVPDNTGRIEVNLNKPTVAAFSESDFEIHLYRGTNDLGLAVGAPTSGDFIQKFNGVNGTINYFTTNTLTPGFYTLVAISSNAAAPGCRSIPVKAEIKQITTKPLIEDTQIDANTNCSGVTANGSIALSIDMGANANDYDFDWFEGMNTTSPALGSTTTGAEAGVNGEVIVNLPAGKYTVRVTNKTTNCFALKTMQLFNNPSMPSIAAGDLVTTAQTNCTPFNGTATLNAVTVNGIAVPRASYTLAWFDATQTAIQGDVTSVSSLQAGTYFVQATITNSNCATTKLQFTIEDMSMNTVEVNLLSFISPSRCMKPADVNGEFVVEATGNSVSGYTYEWFEGSGTTTPFLPANATNTLSNIMVPIGQPDVTYTVKATNNTTNCSVTDTYLMPVVITPIFITASASPLTHCNPTDPDGQVLGAVTNDYRSEYTYNWSKGATIVTPPDYIGFRIYNLDANDYTVVAIDPLLPTVCFSKPETVSITIEQMFPTVTVMKVNPLSNCDETKPNGTASANVAGNFIDYNFFWYEGTSAIDPYLHEGADYNELKAMTYTVKAVNRLTGCEGTAPISIEFSPTAVPTVTPEVLSNVTSCLTPNGELTASVGGNIDDYIFNWYVGTSVKATADFVGETFSNIDVGMYTVTATSKLTGCTSEPATAEIIAAPLYPDFNFGIQSATCKEDNGYATLYLQNDIEIETIEWNNNGVITIGPNLENIPAGIYSVTVTTFLGCSTTKEIEIKTEIHPFNGISRNGDARNDRFYIDCIDNFPGNIVRIFNRAGTLVYEERDYDNIDIFFDGQANKGISVLGNNLPDGTYFYVVDKQDGSKPLAGYLEIVN